MYTVRELRTKLKEALDSAEKGESVEIRRGETIFLITTITEKDLLDIKREEVLDKLPPTGTLLTNRTQVGDVPQPKQPDPQVPQPCPDCQKPNVRCKHWDYEPLSSTWKNRMTGEVREAAL